MNARSQPVTTWFLSTIQQIVHVRTFSWCLLTLAVHPLFGHSTMACCTSVAEQRTRECRLLACVLHSPEAHVRFSALAGTLDVNWYGIHRPGPVATEARVDAFDHKALNFALGLVRVLHLVQTFEGHVALWACRRRAVAGDVSDAVGTEVVVARKRCRQP